MSEIRLTVTFDDMAPDVIERFVRDALYHMASGDMGSVCLFVDRLGQKSGLLRRTRRGSNRYTLHIRREVAKRADQGGRW